MLTQFQSPTIITQVESFNEVIQRASIPWIHSENIINKDEFAVSTRPLHTISGFWQEKFYSETHRLMTSGYNFTDTDQTVVGIEALISIQRLARIQDLVIQLTIDGELVGDNLASTINPVQADQYTAEVTIPLDPVGDINIYGGGDNTWGREWTSADIANPTFGIAVSFRSNQIIPHSDLVYLDQVALRITYA